MSEVVDLDAFKQRQAQDLGIDIVDGKDFGWLTKITRENLGDNFRRIGELVGSEAVRSLMDRLDYGQIISLGDDESIRYGRLQILRGDRVILGVSNRNALLFTAKIPGPDKIESSAKVASLLVAATLVASSSFLVDPSGSEDMSLWDDNFDPIHRECLRFAGGIVNNTFGFSFSSPKTRTRANVVPQLAGLINPFSLNEIQKNLRF